MPRTRPALSVVPEPTAEPADGHDEAHETLRAIRAGEVDAFVVAGREGERVLSLANADGPYRLFVEHMQEGAATLSPTGEVLFANARLAEMLGLPREAIVGSALATHAAGATDSWEGGATTEFDLVDSTGARVPVLVSCSSLDLDGEQFTCLTFADMTAVRTQEREVARLNRIQADQLAELRVAQNALTRQATHDSLTGLPNRTLLVDRVDQALAQAQRTGLCVAVLFVDLDRFKRINDTLGHAAGDAMLRHVGATLVDALRPMDTVARLGGDEFIVLAPAVKDSMHALEMSRRVSDRLAGETTPDGLSIIASIGVAISVGGRGTAELLLHEADTAMYAAKALGGGGVEIFDPSLGRQAQRHVRARQALESALEEQRVVPHFQPIVDLFTDSVAGFEALARIDLPDGSLLPPDAFIPIAEETGLVVPLGTQVLERSCQTAAAWPARWPGPGPSVAVNVSARQLARNVSQVVIDTLATSGLDPTRLHLELTETAVMDLHPDTLKELGRIRDLGVEIGLDDFGTGYASLTHLRRLPLTFVKIDQSFVQEIAVGSEDERIVAAVIDLAANLGLRSIGEGVETEEQRTRLADLGCDQAQGYHFARPMPASEVPGMLA